MSEIRAALGDVLTQSGRAIPSSLGSPATAMLSGWPISRAVRLKASRAELIAALARPVTARAWRPRSRAFGQSYHAGVRQIVARVLVTKIAPTCEPLPHTKLAQRLVRRRSELGFTVALQPAT